MKITRKSSVSGIERTLEIDVTQEQLDNWKKGMLIQQAMPNLTSSEREFIMTGIVDEEWDEIMKEEDDSDSEESAF